MTETSAQPEAPAPSFPARAREWIWRGQAFASAARAGAQTLESEQRWRFDQAQRLLLAAARLEPALRMPLLRDAAYWTLRAYDPGEEEGTIETALALASPELFASASGGDEATVRRLLFGAIHRRAAAESYEELAADVEALQGFVQSLVRRIEHRGPGAQLLLFQRAWRVSVAVLAVSIAIVAVGVGVNRALTKPDLARAKAWRASSIYGGGSPVGRTDTAHPGQPFFHTNQEENPWVEIDLGSVMTVSRVDVDNRQDCCDERAVPMVVEVGTVAGHLTQVGKQDTAFSSHTFRFSARPVRYVRLRVLRQTFFHLDRVAVR